MLLLILLLLTMGTGFFVFNAVSSVSLNAANNRHDERALTETRDALIAWSVARGETASDITGASNDRPGEFPCPDTKAPSDVNYGTQDASCTSGKLGRVPWKTLGIAEPKDAYGETLWYAVDGPFRKYSLSSAPITSNTVGTRTVYSGSTATTVTTQAVAVLFAPGPILELATAQRRETAAEKTTASNYLESTGGANNSTNNGPFIMAPASTTFNDRILVITAAELMPLVEQRVAREMMAILAQYKAATATSTLYSGGVYPWADLANGDSNDGSNGAYNRGRLPCGSALPVDWNEDVPSSSPSTKTPRLPLWLTNGCWSTGWTFLIYYAVAKNRLEYAGLGSGSPLWIPGCGTCTSTTLRVDGVYGYELLLLTPGAYLGNPPGPARNWPTSYSTITGYFEDSENADNNNDNFVTPTVSVKAYNRDRIFKLP